jgi:elongation of very long chain fatty acids protein 6
MLLLFTAARGPLAATVMLYCWEAIIVLYTGGSWFCGMNLVVHSLMYSYFALASAGVRFSRTSQQAITVLQIVQMVAGIFITVHNALVCNSQPTLTAFALLMYFSYFVLFVQFFVAKYSAKKQPAAKKAE